MALFKRNKTTIDNDLAMPQELQEYYAAESRNRGWMAWVLGLTTLFVTVVIALGLFYGGRYTYRKLAKKDNKPQVAQTETHKEGDSSHDETKEEDESETSAPTSDTSTTTGTDAPHTSSTSTSTPSNTSPTVTGTVTTIPNTGTGNTIAIFVAVSLLGYFAHRRFAKN